MPFTVTQSGIITVSNSAANESYLAATIDPVTGDLVVVWSSDGANGGVSGTFTTTYGPDIENGGFPAVRMSDSYGEVSIASISDNTAYAITINVTAPGASHGIHVASSMVGLPWVEEEYILDTTTTGTQILSTQLVRTADGGAIGTWTSEVGDSSGNGILALNFNGNGVSAGVTHVNTYTANNQINSSVAALSGGGYVIAWESEGQDAGHDGIYMQRYDASGHKSGSEMRVNTTSGDEATPDIGAMTGGYVITWVSQGTDGTSDIMGQRYTASGSKSGGEFQISSAAAANSEAQVAGLSNGGFAVAWEQTNGDQHVLLAQMYDSSGAKSGEQIFITSSNHALTDLDVTTFADGFLVTWSGIGADGTANAYMERFGSAYDNGHYITGTDSDDTLKGDYGRDTLIGGAGNDALWNGEIMFGGAGNDIFYAESGQIDGGDGVDEVDFHLNGDMTVDLQAGTFLNTTYNTAATLVSIENVVTTTGDDKLYGNSSANTLSGGFGDDILDGRGGADTLMGGDGSDTYYVDNAGDIIIDDGLDYRYYYDTEYSSVSRGPDAGIEILRLTGSANLSATAGADLIKMFGNAGNNALTGNAGDNSLFGNAGNDTLNGGVGADIMDGGVGNDTYYVDNIGDTVIEGAAGGTDTVYASATYSASGQFVENIYMTGTGNISVTGNSLNNLLIGNSGNNTLNGGGGADTLNGGAGNDTYIIDNAGDIVIEGATGGIDAIYASSTYSINGTYIENLFLTGSGNINASGNGYDNLLIGNEGSNTLNGSIGADTMNGGSGNDTYIVDNAGDVVIEGATGGTDTVYAGQSYSLTGSYVENLFLTGTADINATGNAGDNLLVGNAGNNVFNGGAGADTMNGGAGNDLYYVDNAGDIIIEGNGGGTDSVYAGISYSLTGSYLENLFLTGSGNINATGNAGDNLLVGNSGNNILNGGAGADTMNGGLGNDTYYIDNIGDTIIEGSTGGADTVYASLSWSLSGTYLENLILDGTANINATGNGSDNIITGNSGSNTLNGGAGNDRLNGGAGNDILIGGAGNDIFYGGNGNDTYYVDSPGDVVIENDGDGTDTVISSISYTPGQSYIETVILAGTANINATGTSADYMISGGFTGNTLIGNTGNNNLTAGAGNDILTGGGGNDTFTFAYFSGGADTITDFSNDTINLNAYSHGVANGGGIVIAQAGSNTTIDLGGGNIITLTGTVPADLNGHIVW